MNLPSLRAAPPPSGNTRKRRLPLSLRTTSRMAARQRLVQISGSKSTKGHVLMPDTKSAFSAKSAATRSLAIQVPDAEPAGQPAAASPVRELASAGDCCAARLHGPYCVARSVEDSLLTIDRCIWCRCSSASQWQQPEAASESQPQEAGSSQPRRVGRGQPSGQRRSCSGHRYGCGGSRGSRGQQQPQEGQEARQEGGSEEHRP